MKKCLLLLLVALMLIMLASCGCEHQWAEADCDSAKTCTNCGETEGAPLGHSWLAATCRNAKTCEICGAVDGTPLAHTWVDATCQSPKTCSVCQATEGEPLAHTWEDATCDTAKTCSACGAVEGEPLGHVYSDEVKCEEAKTCGVCGYSDGVIPGHTWVNATETAPKTCSTCGATEGEPLVVPDLNITFTYFMGLMEKALDVYDVTLEYWMTDSEGIAWYDLMDEDGQEMDVHMFFELASDGATLEKVTIYTESALEGQNAYWTGVLGGCSMVIVDPTLTNDDLTAMTSEVSFSQNGTDYYVLDKNDICHVMAADEATGSVFFVIYHM